MTGSGRWWLTSSTAAAPPRRPRSDPTDRSISPAMMTNTIPHARMPVIAICRIRFDRLRADVKPPSVCQLKKAQIRAIAASSASILYSVNSRLILIGFMLSIL
jgi:hypothetical protein